VLDGLKLRDRNRAWSAAPPTRPTATRCPSTLNLAKAADAVLFGAVGDWKYDKLPRPLPARAGHPGPAQAPGPVRQLPPGDLLRAADPRLQLKPEVVAGLDILIIRELTGDIYFGQPRGRRVAVDGHFPGAEEAFDTMRYSRPEIQRIAHVAFQAARKRNKKVTSVDKANVLETFQFWKDVVTEVHAEYPDVAGAHVRGQRRDAAGQGNPRPSTWWSPATCSATSCPTRRRC
jgi:3-isopropylmalate dehydrogenase